MFVLFVCVLIACEWVSKWFLVDLCRGGVYATKQSHVKLQGVEMVGCRADVDGGALFAEEHSKINVTHSALAQSSAGNNGGTLTIGSSAIGVLMHCEIDHSVAGMNGGVVHVTTVSETGTGDLVRAVGWIHQCVYCMCCMCCIRCSYLIVLAPCAHFDMY